MGFWLEALVMSSKHVPERVVKKQKTAASIAESDAAARTALKAKRRQNRREIYKRAQKYAKEYHQMQRAEITARRQAKEGGKFYNFSVFLNSIMLPLLDSMMLPSKCYVL